MTEAKGPYIYAKDDDIVASVGNVSVTVKIGNSDEAIIANMAYARGVADERERCARIASVEWSNGKNSVVRAEELASNLCQRIENKIRKG